MIYSMKVIDLLKQSLPQDYVKAILKNVKDKEDLNQDAESLEVELLSLFDWEQSEEGFEFWAKVLDRVISGDRMPRFNDLKEDTVKLYIDYSPGTTIFADGQIRVFNVSGIGIDIKLDYNSPMAKDSFPEISEKYYTWMN